MIKIKYTIKNDVIFNYLFSHEDILKEFLEACLGKNIEKVEVTNQFSLNKVKYHDKVGVLDIRAKINKDKLVDIINEIYDLAKEINDYETVLFITDFIYKKLVDKERFNNFSLESEQKKL